MEKQRLLELCQWDFVSYEAALAISPYKTDVIRYKKETDPFQATIPATHEIKITTELFGFYSWMPTDKDDRAVVLEQKTQPKPWTDYKPKDLEQTQFICLTIEALVRERGFLVGVNCTGEQWGEGSF
jgi:hypothetical protein